MEIRDVLPRDAIPSIDDPVFGTTYIGEPDDEVVVLPGDPPRAYPIRILSYHEVVNDSAGGTPIAVTWCPICWSAAVYDRTVDGRVLEFGVSGKLADDALVLYDRVTGSEWKQSSGVCLAGPLEGERLRVRPAGMTTWAQFDQQYPDGITLQAAGRDPESYEMEPYRRYREADNFGADVMRGTGLGRSWDRANLDPKAVVLGLERGGEALGFPRPRVLAAGGVVRHTVGDLPVVVFATDAGIDAFENPGMTFRAADDGFRADGARWNGTAGESDDGRRLTRVPARRLFAFAWQDDHGPSAFYRPGTSEGEPSS